MFSVHIESLIVVLIGVLVGVRDRASHLCTSDETVFSVDLKKGKKTGEVQRRTSNPGQHLCAPREETLFSVDLMGTQFRLSRSPGMPDPKP